jgi:spore maturation protein CgeB
MKILYAAGLSPNDTSLYRMWALERLGHQVIPVNTYDYQFSNSLARKVFFRLATGPMVARLNRDLLNVAAAEKPDLLWTDKLLSMRPATLDRMRKMGIATVSYMIDNPFGPRQDPGWRLYMKDIPHYDLHVVQRDKNILDYRQRGARDVIKIQTAYEPTVQYPPPEGWSDANRNREVSFVGTPYDNRAETLTRLSNLNEFQVTISGNDRQWRRALDADAFNRLYREGELYRQQYREAIWRSKINLSFITHSNQDEFVHKSFEIAGCGGFLLAERSDGHLQRFREDEEAVFFSTYDELLQKIRRWLPDEAGRALVAAKGAQRAREGKYHNDGQMVLILNRLNEIVPRVRLNSTSSS